MQRGEAVNRDMESATNPKNWINFRRIKLSFFFFIVPMVTDKKMLNRIHFDLYTTQINGPPYTKKKTTMR